MQLKITPKSGFTLVEILIVVAIIGLLVAIALPNLVKARENTQKNGCIENLKQIDGAKHVWAFEKKKAATETPNENELYGTTLYIRDTPSCPAAGTYTMGDLTEKPACNITGHTLP